MRRIAIFRDVGRIQSREIPSAAAAGLSAAPRGKGQSGEQRNDHREPASTNSACSQSIHDPLSAARRRLLRMTGFGLRQRCRSGVGVVEFCAAGARQRRRRGRRRFGRARLRFRGSRRRRGLGRHRGLRRRRCGGSGRLRTQLALQLAQFLFSISISRCESASWLFQILDAILERLGFTAGRGLAAALVGTAAGTRGDQTQMAARGGARRCPARHPSDDALRSSPRFDSAPRFHRRPVRAARHRAARY